MLQLECIALIDALAAEHVIRKCASIRMRCTDALAAEHVIRRCASIRMHCTDALAAEHVIVTITCTFQEMWMQAEQIAIWTKS